MITNKYTLKTRPMVVEAICEHPAKNVYSGHKDKFTIKNGDRFWACKVFYQGTYSGERLLLWNKDRNIILRYGIDSEKVKQIFKFINIPPYKEECWKPGISELNELDHLIIK